MKNSVITDEYLTCERFLIVGREEEQYLRDVGRFARFELDVAVFVHNAHKSKVEFFGVYVRRHRGYYVSGQTALHRMNLSESRSAVCLVSPITADLVDAYTAPPPPPLTPVMTAVLPCNLFIRVVSEFFSCYKSRRAPSQYLPQNSRGMSIIGKKGQQRVSAFGRHRAE